MLQTFISLDKSEEVQIKGRTARQGELGSYSMVLHCEELEAIGITSGEVEEMMSTGYCYDTLDRKRNEKFDQDCNTKVGGGQATSYSLRQLHWYPVKNNYGYFYIYRPAQLAHSPNLTNPEAPNSLLYITPHCYVQVLHIQQSAGLHRMSMTFLDQLFQHSDVDEDPNKDVLEFLLRNNLTPHQDMSGGIQSRTVVAIDATMSMQKTIEACKNTVMKIFQGVYETLQEMKCPSSFQLLICFYRNYNSGVKLFEASSWESEPANLSAFIEKVTAQNGGHRSPFYEAVEVPLQFVNSRALGEVTQVILIGDEKPNTRDDVAYYRDDFMRGFDWSKTLFAAPTHYSDEVAALQNKGIPVHTFWVKRNCQLVFEQIARDTGGSCHPLEMGSEDGAAALKKLVCTTVLEDIGRTSGSHSAKDLVGKYAQLCEMGRT